jgi:hypothetical protein
MNPLTNQINAYFAVLIITVFGSGATLLIVHIANASTFTVFETESQQQASVGL